MAMANGDICQALSFPHRRKLWKGLRCDSSNRETFIVALSWIFENLVQSGNLDVEEDQHFKLLMDGIYGLPAHRPLPPIPPPNPRSPAHWSETFRPSDVGEWFMCTCYCNVRPFAHPEPENMAKLRRTSGTGPDPHLKRYSHGGDFRL